MDSVNSNGSRILRLNEVMERTGRSRSSIYLDMDLGKFPKSIRLGRRAIGWLESEVEAWIQKCIKETRATD